MAEETTNPPQTDEDSGTGGWLKKNWWKALLGIIGGFMLFASGGEMLMMIIGLLLVAVAATTILKPEMLDKAGDMVDGLRQKAAERIPQLQITRDGLATKQPDLGKLSPQETAFEQWALSDEVLSKLDEKDKGNLKAILDKMRSGADAEQVKLSEQDVQKFVSGLDNNAISDEQKAALRQTANDKLQAFR